MLTQSGTDFVNAFGERFETVTRHFVGTVVPKERFGGFRSVQEPCRAATNRLPHGIRAAAMQYLHGNSTAVNHNLAHQLKITV